MFVRAYLRASTDQQDANRARADLEAFATERGLSIASWYVENESGASLQRPELFRLLADCKHGDVLLIEQVDRLSRLNESDWQKLKGMIAERGIRIVALDLPTSWNVASNSNSDSDDVVNRIMQAVNAMILDVLAAVARKDYQDRRRRQAQGIKKAVAEGRYKGRPEDAERNSNIVALLNKGVSWSQVQQATGCSRSTISRLTKASRGSVAVL